VAAIVNPLFKRKITVNPRLKAVKASPSGLGVLKELSAVRFAVFGIL
jgi:hypothetical protein